MKRLLVFLVAALCMTVGADGNARPRRHHPVAAAKRAAKHERHPARARHRTGRNSAPLAKQGDELVLSPALLQQLQRNLVDGGYLRSAAADGRMTPRTRRALAEFQREYHLRGSGALDRATAEALLGRDALSGKETGPQSFDWSPLRKTPAASYSPTRTTVQYHRPWRA